ncbi:CAP domain-containing protein [Limimaricola cinnabarinus]|uniref:CAP domain-containing protein n=1 Tax=Limimaricola cinnabarinus TaxID=1125964 RepID=UPI0024907E2F|nr:CAP domain-containing protein [Limimaricola cinnabarinus]
MSIANTLERQMLDLVNDERTERGLTPLSLERNLNASSEDHSSWMLRNDVFSHTGANGSSATERMRDADFDFSGGWASGENLAWQSERGASGLADDVIDLHESLMNSPGHRANILNPNFEVIGIGIESGDFRGWDGVMVTQNFARTGGAVELDTGAVAPRPIDAPPARNSAPAVEVDDIVLAKVQGGRRTKLDKHLQTEDADGDAIEWFELRDTAGRDNFIFRGEGRIDADAPYRVDADDLDLIRVRVNARLGETTLQVRASDGEDVGAWETFTLTTFGADDMQFA